MEEKLELCNTCGIRILPVGELLYCKVVYNKKVVDIKSCNTCYSLLLKYPVEESTGNYKVDSEFKYSIIKVKKVSDNKRSDKLKGDLIIPRITVKGKEKLEKIDPWILGVAEKKKAKKKKDNFYNNLNLLLGRPKNNNLKSF
tara:strand:- start:1906 stop:2331 length:426 start_codon:yes stop_codon:yes gene_type:complete